MHLNKLNLIGIMMIVSAFFIYFTNVMDHLILNITYPFLEGSSKGKSVILFGIMGSLLLFYPLFNPEGFFGNIIAKIDPFLSFNSQKYLKITIILIASTYLIGMFLEIFLRAKFGVSLFTTFLSFSPGASSTSITHSHIIKSILGSFIDFVGIYVPSQINTGVSLSQYLSPRIYIIFILFPLVYLTGLISLSSRNDLIKIIFAFGLTVSLIGMLDGGLFSTPALLGLLVLLICYFVKTPFSPKYITKPVVIVALLIFIRISIGLMGTNTEFHEVTILNPSENIDLNPYDIKSLQKENSKLVVKVPGAINDKVLLIKLIDDLNGKSTGFFLSWNIYSWT